MAAPMVIAGAGVAGVHAAPALRECGWLGPITLIGDELLAPYDRPRSPKAAIDPRVLTRAGDGVQRSGARHSGHRPEAPARDPGGGMTTRTGFLQAIATCQPLVYGCRQEET